MTTYEERDGRLVRMIDRGGHVWAALDWDGDRLRALRVPGAIVDGAVTPDALLGDAHVITCGARTTTMSAIDWARPTTIPTVAAPGRLAPGSGGAIMNVIALLAARAGVPALRYAGRYPTAALFQTLCRSFRTTASEATFTEDLLERLAGTRTEPLPIDFVPAPFTALAHAHGHVELRDGLARAVIDHVSYEPGGSPARLVDTRAELWFGDAIYAHVATFAPDGSLVAGPHAIPRCTSEVLGQPFPAALVDALAELVAEAVPLPLADDAQAYVAGCRITWADLGARPARATPAGLEVHAVLWERLGPLGPARLALALAEALAPVVTGAVVARVMGAGP